MVTAPPYVVPGMLEMVHASHDNPVCDAIMGAIHAPKSVAMEIVATMLAHPSYIRQLLLRNETFTVLSRPHQYSRFARLTHFPNSDRTVQVQRDGTVLFEVIDAHSALPLKLLNVVYADTSLIADLQLWQSWRSGQDTILDASLAGICGLQPMKIQPQLVLCHFAVPVRATTTCHMTVRALQNLGPTRSVLTGSAINLSTPLVSAAYVACGRHMMISNVKVVRESLSGRGHIVYELLVDVSIVLGESSIRQSTLYRYLAQNKTRLLLTRPALTMFSQRFSASRYGGNGILDSISAHATPVEGDSQPERNHQARVKLGVLLPWVDQMGVFLERPDGKVLYLSKYASAGPVEQMDMARMIQLRSVAISLLALPTGAGKSQICVQVAAIASGRVIIVVPDILFTQWKYCTQSTLAVDGAGNSREWRVWDQSTEKNRVLLTTFSVARRHSSTFPLGALLIIDEIHILTKRVLAALQITRPRAVIGVTATPAKAFDNILEIATHHLSVVDQTFFRSQPLSARVQCVLHQRDKVPIRVSYEIITFPPSDAIPADFYRQLTHDLPKVYTHLKWAKLMTILYRLGKSTSPTEQELLMSVAKILMDMARQASSGSVIHTLSIRAFSATQVVYGNAQTDDCGICLSLLEEPMVLACGHMFCLECCMALFACAHSRCAVCRAALHSPFYVRHAVPTNNSKKRVLEEETKHAEEHKEEKEEKEEKQEARLQPAESIVFDTYIRTLNTANVVILGSAEELLPYKHRLREKFAERTVFEAITVAKSGVIEEFVHAATPKILLLSLKLHTGLNIPCENMLVVGQTRSSISMSQVLGRCSRLGVEQTVITFIVADKSIIHAQAINIIKERRLLNANRNDSEFVQAFFAAEEQ